MSSMGHRYQDPAFEREISIIMLGLGAGLFMGFHIAQLILSIFISSDLNSISFMMYIMPNVGLVMFIGGVALHVNWRSRLQSSERSCLPIIGGMLLYLGTILLWSYTVAGYMVNGQWGFFGDVSPLNTAWLLLSVLPLIAGILAFNRRMWLLVIVLSIPGLLSFTLIAIGAIIAIMASKDEFSSGVPGRRESMADRWGNL